MSEKLEIKDIKPGLIIINNAISSTFQYIERIDEVINNNLITITAACRNRITTNNEIDWYSMGTFYQTLDEESIYNNIRRARINEIWYFRLNMIENGRTSHE